MQILSRCIDVKLQILSLTYILHFSFYFKKKYKLVSIREPHIATLTKLNILYYCEIIISVVGLHIIKHCHMHCIVSSRT